MSKLLIHIRKQPDDATMKPAWCGAVGGPTITEAFGYYGPEGPGFADVCQDCNHKQRASWRGVKVSSRVLGEGPLTP